MISSESTTRIRLEFGRIIRVALIFAAGFRAGVIPANEPERESAATPTTVPLPIDRAGSRSTSGSPRFTGSGNFWIVSTRNRTQKLTAALRNPPAVYHVNPRGNLGASNCEQLVASINPGLPLCVMIHGSFVNWSDVLEESRRTHEWLERGCGEPIQFIFFSWPSDDFHSLFVNLDVGRLGRRSAANGIYLANLLRKLPAESRVTLIGHSHGARVISSALHLLGGGAVQDTRLAGHPSHPTRMRAIFAAAAIDHHWLNPGERYERALPALEGLLNLRNSRDAALLVYPLRRPFSHRALGSTSLKASDRRHLGCRAGRFHEIDVSDSIGLAHGWPAYSCRPQLAFQISRWISRWTVPDAAE